MRKSERTHSLTHSLARSPSSGQQIAAAVARDDGIEEGRDDADAAGGMAWRVMTAQKEDLNWPQLKIQPLAPLRSGPTRSAPPSAPTNPLRTRRRGCASEASVIFFAESIPK